MTTISTLRMVLLCLSLLGIPLAVKAQTACMNCNKAFPCSQNYKNVPIPVKYIRLGTTAKSPATKAASLC